MRIRWEKEARDEERRGRVFGPPSAISPYQAGRLEHMLGTPRAANPCDPAGPWWARWDEGWRDRDAGIDAPPVPEEPAAALPAPLAPSRPVQLALDL